MDKMEYVHMFEEEESHWWYIGMRAIVRALLPPDTLPENPRVLDAGCGTGYNMGWLKQNYHARMTGFDYSQLGLEFCRRRGEQCISRADAAAIPFAGGSFDVVVSFDVLTQLKDETARNAALREFQRVLKPGGCLLLRVAAYEFLRSSHDEVIMTYHRFGRSELRDAAINAGLRPIRLTGANTILFPAAALWRMLKKAGLAPAGSDVRSNTRGSSGLNRAMTNLLKLEAAIIRRSNFPFGLSILLLAEK
jgi:ubiquinone/menaquinone biosynthesis C-methylase UbiE